MYEIKIKVLDEWGCPLSVEKRPWAPVVFEFDMLEDALDFLTNYLDGRGYLFSEDGSFETHKIESFTATEYGQDVTDQLDDAFQMR